MEPCGVVRSRHQGEPLQVLSSSWKASEGREVQCLSLLLEVFIYTDQSLSPFLFVPQVVFPWTPNSARARKKAETSSRSFPRALPSLPWLILLSRSWLEHHSRAAEEAVELA